MYLAVNNLPHDNLHGDVSSNPLAERITSECELPDSVSAMGSADGFTAVIRPENQS